MGCSWGQAIPGAQLAGTTPWKTIKHSKTSSAKSSPLHKEMQLESILRKNSTSGLLVYFLLGTAGRPRRKDHDIGCVLRTINVHSAMRTLAGWRFVALDGSTGIFRRTWPFLKDNFCWFEGPRRGTLEFPSPGPPANETWHRKRKTKKTSQTCHQFVDSRSTGVIQLQGPNPSPSSNSCLGGTKMAQLFFLALVKQWP